MLPSLPCRCETHKVETIRANVIGCLNLADVCLQNGIHMTYYGTGAARVGRNCRATGLPG